MSAFAFVLAFAVAFAVAYGDAYGDEIIIQSLNNNPVSRATFL